MITVEIMPFIGVLCPAQYNYILKTKINSRKKKGIYKFWIRCKASKEVSEPNKLLTWELTCYWYGKDRPVGRRVQGVRCIRSLDRGPPFKTYRNKIEQVIKGLVCRKLELKKLLWLLRFSIRNIDNHWCNIDVARILVSSFLLAKILTSKQTDRRAVGHG